MTAQLSREELKQQLIECSQNAAGMFEVGEDTMCAMMALIEGMDSEPVAAPGVMYDPRTATTGSATMLKPGTLTNEGTKPVSPRYMLPDGWIKCSERMPENMDTVIISNGIDRGQGWWDGDSWQSWSRYDSVPDEVTHWMSLPAAPEQEV